ncbi:MAG: hypothetical protein RDV48_17875 [Candidatus Eremiobacteraeota bacterium]|nr:hypothetical protein [Candidatus Eremiobacteraeota bacterium]
MDEYDGKHPAKAGAPLSDLVCEAEAYVATAGKQREALSESGANKPSGDDPRQLLVFAGAAVFLVLFYLCSLWFNASLGLKEGQRGGSLPSMTGKEGEGPPAESAGRALPSMPGMEIPLQPHVNTVVYDSEPLPREPSPVPSPEPRKVDRSRVPADYHLVREDTDGMQIYVDPNAEAYVIFPGDQKPEKAVIRHGP